MEEWHLSKYIIYSQLPNDNRIIGFNLIRGTHFYLTPEELSFLFNFKQLAQDNPILKNFKKIGLLINYDELELIHTINRQLNNNFTSLTICPTINCNFDCPYCFENHYPGKMSEKTQNDIIELTKKLLLYSKNKSLHITWYGGEPLLAIDVIESLSKKFFSLVEENKIKYSASIITNGFLLDQEKADILSNYKVTNYQITLDGLEETHNKTRRLANGGPTFDVIINNLRNNKINGKINIRYNVHKDNVQDFNITKQLIYNISKQSGNNISIYPALVVDNAPQEREGQVKVLSDENAYQIALLKSSYCKIGCKSHFCGAQSLYGLVIDPQGRLYKCWEDVDKVERSFGNVKTWEPKNPFFSATNLDIITKYLNSTGVLDDEECQKCILLPICAGECPSKRIYHKKHCYPFKNNIDEYAFFLANKVLEKNRACNS